MRTHTALPWRVISEDAPFDGIPAFVFWDEGFASEAQAWKFYDRAKNLWERLKSTNTSRLVLVERTVFETTGSVLDRIIARYERESRWRRVWKWLRGITE